MGAFANLDILETVYTGQHSLMENARNQNARIVTPKENYMLALLLATKARPNVIAGAAGDDIGGELPASDFLSSR